MDADTVRRIHGLFGDLERLASPNVRSLASSSSQALQDTRQMNVCSVSEVHWHRDNLEKLLLQPVSK